MLLLHRLQMLVAWKDSFLENYLAILVEQKLYLSVWLRASNERYFSFNWRLVIIKHEKLFAAKFCPERNVRFINCSQLLPPRPLITYWNWKLLGSPFIFSAHFSIHVEEPLEQRNVFCSTSEPSQTKEGMFWIPSWKAFNFNCAWVNINNF